MPLQFSLIGCHGYHLLTSMVLNYKYEINVESDSFRQQHYSLRISAVHSHAPLPSQCNVIYRPLNTVSKYALLLAK